MTFQPGNNLGGRPAGSRNKRTQQILDLIKDNKDPLVALSEIVSTSDNPDHRISASNILAPYLHSKRGTIPAPRFLETPLEVPEFHSVQNALDFLDDINRRSAAGELELQSALDISTLVKNWILSVTAQDELQLKISKEAPQGPQQITITGGLGPLPGTSIAMDPDGLYAKEPMLNINHNGHVIDHDPTAPNGAVGIESAPSEPTESPTITKG